MTTEMLCGVVQSPSLTVDRRERVSIEPPPVRSPCPHLTPNSDACNRYKPCLTRHEHILSHIMVDIVLVSVNIS